MANMSYCRFENTLSDLRDCLEALRNDDLKELSRTEKESARELIELSMEISEMFEDDDLDEVFND